MQANPNDAMDRRYKELTEKQRAVIDAHAQRPDATNREKARIAGEEILGDDEPVNESYSSEIINKKFPDLADYRAELEQNERPQGAVQTTGDPFSNIASDDSSSSEGFQSIQDRPIKQLDEDNSDDQEQSQPAEPVTQQAQRQAQPQGQPQAQIGTGSPIQVADTGDGIAIKLSYRYVQGLLESQDTQLPDDLHQQLVNVVLRSAFN